MKAEAIVMRRTGDPAVLGLEDVELPQLRDGEVRIRSLASAVNHSDLEIRAGLDSLFPAALSSRVARKQ
ncbi:MAG: hypothetical protein CVT60_03305 [Actinobacteria bacterium HGW-Actinobacteria-10]|nr:MAG: hypothetical protein CVT60_03305 [Actinobacteria bacterium HGW-Actinobacteria-10]